MLNELCNLNGISGREHAVRDYIISHLPSDAEYRIDPLGSLIVYKKGKAEPKNKVMLDAHMDEVGFIITYITDDGYLKFTTVGGIDERVIFGRAVKVGKELIPGVIGGKAIHQTTSEERGKLPSVEDMYIDIGASLKKRPCLTFHSATQCILTRATANSATALSRRRPLTTASAVKFY